MTSRSDPTPTTEAGRHDHDEAWDGPGPNMTQHLNIREDCPACAKIALIEAQARAEALDVDVLARAIQADEWPAGARHRRPVAEQHQRHAERLAAEYRAILAGETER